VAPEAQGAGEDTWTLASHAGISEPGIPYVESDAVELPRVGERFGPFRLDGELGSGGLGVVYRAYDPPGDRHVALKVPAGRLSDERRERFAREGVLAARLQHPGIVRVFSAGDVGGVPWISYELVEGSDLSELLPSMERDERLRIVREVAEALAHAHDHEVVHRDVKPANVLVDRQGRARVTDFGLALTRGLTRLTVSGAMLGTPRCMAPEQLVSAKEGVGPATDVWALGVLLYEVLTDKPPFPADTLHTLLAQVLASRPTPPRELDPSIPPALSDLCLRALTRNPAARPADARAFLGDLQRALAGDVDPSTRALAAHFLLAGFALASVLGVLAWALRPVDRGPTQPTPAGPPPASHPPPRSSPFDPADDALRRGDGEAAEAALSALAPDTPGLARRKALAALVRGERLGEEALEAGERQWIEVEASRQAVLASLVPTSPDHWLRHDERMRAAVSAAEDALAADDHPLVGRALRRRLGEALVELILDTHFEATLGNGPEVASLVRVAERLLPADPRPGWARDLITRCRSRRPRLGMPPARVEAANRDSAEAFGPRWSALAWSWHVLDADETEELLDLDGESPVGASVPHPRYNEYFVRDRAYRDMGAAFAEALMAELGDPRRTAERLRHLFARGEVYLEEALRTQPEDRGPGVTERLQAARLQLFAGRVAAARQRLDWTDGQQSAQVALVEAECARLEGALAKAESALARVPLGPPERGPDLRLDRLGLVALLAQEAGRPAAAEAALAEAKALSQAGASPTLPWLAPEWVAKMVAGGPDPRRPLWEALGE
jgi:hypothetical protein